tara:strand:+ start:148 stop:771 length:624 start_codon:yes stop_codon:yes gene_type:complete
MIKKTISNLKEITKMNEALIKQFKIAKVKNYDVLAKGTGIDKSTISLHLSNKRKISLDHAKLYSDFLNVPLIKIIDDNISKYRVVRYVDDSGKVTPGDEDDDDIVVLPNEIEKTEDKIIYNKEQQMAYWYNPNIDCFQVNILDKLSYVKSENISRIGKIVSITKANIVVQDLITKETYKISKANKCYPIVKIELLEYSNSVKLQNSL